MTPSHGPWVDLHAHAGRCFLAGLPDDDPVAAALGGDGTATAIDAARTAGLTTIGMATVADLRVLGFTPEGALKATRAFAPGESHVDNTRQLSALIRIVETAGCRIVRRADDIGAAQRDGELAVLVSCEGADFVDDELARVAEVHELGVRVITLVHYAPNRFGDLQTEPPSHGGLSDVGRALVTEMNRLGMIIDLAHATAATTYDVLEVSQAPVMISHTHLQRPDAPHPRLVDTPHARAVAEAGGLIGAWPAGVTSRTFDDFVDEVIRLVEAVGVDRVGIGTDLDANYAPVLTSYDQFAAVANALITRGLAASEIDQVLGGNAVALIGTVCG